MRGAVALMDLHCDIQIWPFPKLILIRGFRQTKRFNSRVPHPPHTHTHCAASQQAPHWHFLEKQVRCQQQYVSFHIVTVSARVREGREWEKRDGRFFAGLVLSVTFCLINLFILPFFVRGRGWKNKHKDQTCWLTLKNASFQECSRN